MDEDKIRKLEENGWKVGDAEDFLDDIQEDSYKKGQLHLIEHLIEWVRDEHDHFISYIDFPNEKDEMDDDEIFKPGNTVRFEGEKCPVENLKRPFVDSLNLEQHLKNLKTQIKKD